MAVFPLNPGATPAMVDTSGTLIPTLWSKKLLERFYDASILPQISNTEYEGEIRNMGDKVIMNRVPAISISNYRMGDTLTYQRPTTETTELLIDQGHYWAFQLDDVQDVQQFMSMMGPWAEDASERLKITVDTNGLAFLLGKAIAANRGLTAGRISTNISLGTSAAPLQVGNGAGQVNPINLIVDLGTVLDEQNIPESGRKLVVPAWFAGLIKKSELKDASLAGDSTSIVRNGRIGTIDRFEIYTSNLLPSPGNAANKAIYAIHPKAMTFATQLTKTEKLRAESTFGDLMRGLLVYGRQVVYPEALAEAIIVKA